MERVAFILHIREGCEEEYDRRHASVWPELLEEMEESGLHRTYIYRDGSIAFVFMETEDYRRCAEMLSQAPHSQRWEEHMVSILKQTSGEAYDPDQAWPEGLPEVFRWESTRAQTETRGLTVAGSMPASGSSWSFVGVNLAESVQIYQTLGIGAVDLIAFPGNPDPPQLSNEPILQGSPAGSARDPGPGCPGRQFQLQFRCRFSRAGDQPQRPTSQGEEPRRLRGRD